MGETFIFTRYPTTCYHCGKKVDQIIKAVRSQAQVVCDNCGATRIFIPRTLEVGAKGLFTRIGCYDLWELSSEASCRNCNLTGPHDLAIGCNHFTVRCQNCGYTHFFRFNLEYLGKCPIEP